MGRPTIHDVAARAEVSKSLVSLALRGSPKVSAASREMIFAAAAELGYRPNAAARSLAAQHSQILGVLLPDLHNPMSADILDGIQATARERGYTTLIAAGGRDLDEQRAEIEVLLELQVDGLILVSHGFTSAEIRRLARDTPTVVVTRRDIAAPHLDVVCNDDVAGIGLAIDHLVSLGHQRIVHPTGGDDPVALDRARGYLEAMEQHGLASYTRSVTGSLTDTGGYTAALTALTALDQPTALVVANDFAAMGALAAAAHAGLRVPEDVSVVGYDGIAIGALRTIDLTSVAQPLRRMGCLAVEQVLHRVEAPAGRARRLTIAPELLVRGTTAPPGTGGGRTAGRS